MNKKFKFQYLSINNSFFEDNLIKDFFEFQKDLVLFQSISFLKYFNSLEQLNVLQIKQDNQLQALFVGKVKQQRGLKIFEIRSTDGGIFYVKKNLLESNKHIIKHAFKQYGFDRLVLNLSNLQEALCINLLSSTRYISSNIEFYMPIWNNTEELNKYLNSTKRNDLKRSQKKEFEVKHFQGDDYQNFIQEFITIENTLFNRLHQVEKVKKSFEDLIKPTLSKQWNGYIAYMEKKPIGGVLFFFDEAMAQTYYFYSSLDKNFSNTGVIDQIIFQHFEHAQSHGSKLLSFMQSSQGSPVANYKRSWAKHFNLRPIFMTHLTFKSKLIFCLLQCKNFFSKK